MLKKLALFLCIITFAANALAFSNDERLANPNDEARAEEFFKTIRCLVCQGESLAESNADLAVDMRNLIREKIAAGQDDEEITEYLVSRYGEGILQKPPFETKTYLLWLTPLVILVLGSAYILKQTKTPAFLKRRKKK